MWSLGYSGSFAVSSVGLSGGLALFWLQSFLVDLKGFSSHFIDVVISEEKCAPWRATFVYGEPRRELRHEFWSLLRRLRGTWDGPWICCGDFNEVLSGDEHFGSVDRSESQMAMFRDCLDECGLMDLGYSGLKFTWNNRQEGDDLVRVRLDRAVANGAFTDRFSGYQVENVITTSSDQLAVSINLTGIEDSPRAVPVKQQFRFEAAWLRAPDYRDVMERAWEEGRDGTCSLQSTFENLQRLSGSLKKWSATTFGAVRKKILKLERRLKGMRCSGAESHEIRKVESELCELFEREEVMARQRSRVDWLREGDRNTAFFHARATTRKRTNKIACLARDDGTKCDDMEEIKGMVHHFYEHLFTAESCPLEDTV
jgi:hypothetical protein